MVTNDQQAPAPQGDSVGTSDPGRQCAETQAYSVPDGRCMPDVVTNDPKAPVKLEGEDPTTFTVPTASAAPQ